MMVKTYQENIRLYERIYALGQNLSQEKNSSIANKEVCVYTIQKHTGIYGKPILMDMKKEIDTIQQ